jgi:hypothetical protein
VGNDGETLVADSSTSTGLRYQSGYNGNAIINGGMDIWQRGTSIASTAANLYSADRWCLGAGTTGRTVSRQTSGLTGNQYAMRVQRDSGNNSTLATYLAYNLESADSYRFAGQTVTISFWARSGANFSPTSSTISLTFNSSTGTDQNILTAWAGSASVVSSSPVLTTSWQRFTYTGTVASNATQLGFYFISSWIGTAGADDWLEITGVQLELGSVATIFKRSNGSGGTIQGELAACQRYFQQVINGNTQNIGAGWNYSSSYAMAILYAPVTMRVEPTIAVTSGTNYYTFERNGGTDSVNAFFGAANSNPNNTITLRNSTEISGTAGDAGLWFSNNASANISLSAEL